MDRIVQGAAGERRFRWRDALDVAYKIAPFVLLFSGGVGAIMRYLQAPSVERAVRQHAIHVALAEEIAAIEEQLYADNPTPQEAWRLRYAVRDARAKVKVLLDSDR